MKRYFIPMLIGAIGLSVLGCDRKTYEKKVTTDSPAGSTEYHKTVKQSDDGSSKETVVKEKTDVNK